MYIYISIYLHIHIYIYIEREIYTLYNDKILAVPHPDRLHVLREARPRV